MVRNVDFCYSRGHCLSQNTSAKVQTQGLTIKKPKPKEFRSKKTKLANCKSSTSLCSNKIVKPNC